MKIILYILAGIISIAIIFLVWFFGFFLQIPELKIPEGASEEQRYHHLDKWLTQLESEHKFNGGILFTRNGEIRFAKTYGYTNASKKEQLTNDSSFRLASISKQFTASGIMLLKEHGKLNYDDLVSKYIKNFPYPEVTIRHLLNHTSGVPDAYMDLATTYESEINILTNKKAVELIIKHKPDSKHKVNEVFTYSNTNYILLARIIELISKQSFETFMRNELFMPLGMQNTRVWNLISEEKTFVNKTDGFEDFDGETETIKPTFLDGVAGDGAIFSSLNDFLIWDKFWTKNNLISQENMQEAFRKPRLNNGEESNYGFGWVFLTDNVMMHNGTWLAANTIFIRDTDKKTSFVLLDNSSNLFFDKIFRAIKN